MVWAVDNCVLMPGSDVCAGFFQGYRASDVDGLQFVAVSVEARIQPGGPAAVFRVVAKPGGNVVFGQGVGDSCCVEEDESFFAGAVAFEPFSGDESDLVYVGFLLGFVCLHEPKPLGAYDVL